MHRKFIALIVSAAVAVTGLSLSAQPARADDTTRILAGIAAIALIGAAIEHSRTKVQIVTRIDPVHPNPIISRPTHPVSRPLPPRFTRYDLPKHCLLQADRYREGKDLVGAECLERYYGSTQALPRDCRVTFWNGAHNRTMFRPGCLQQHGYRLVRR